MDPFDRPRFPAAPAGCVESWFWRANHPTERRAFWLKATVLVADDGTRTADAWCTVFQPGAAFGVRSTVPLSEASFAAPLDLRVSGCEFGRESLTGSLSNQDHAVSWDLRLRPLGGPMGGALCLFPSTRLLDGPLPANKAVTPVAAATLSGHHVVGGERWRVDAWPGMRGHNWGPGHAERYAWGHALFLGSDGAPHTLVEGVSARLRVAGRLTPWISGLVVRRGAREYRFDRIVDLWRQRPAVGDLDWALRIRGRDGEALLSMAADASEVACLGYGNPDGALRYCLNSKLAEVRLRVNPRDDDGFECHSPHGGALEFLRHDADPRWPEAV
jgi:hypothetical protein